MRSLRHPSAGAREGPDDVSGARQSQTENPGRWRERVSASVQAGARASLRPLQAGGQAITRGRGANGGVRYRVGRSTSTRRRGTASRQDGNSEQDVAAGLLQDAPQDRTEKVSVCPSSSCGESNPVPCRQGLAADTAHTRSGHEVGWNPSVSQPPVLEEYINSPDRPLLVRWRPRLDAQAGPRDHVPRQLRCNVAAPFRFESELFEGRAVFWVKGLPSSPPDLFQGYKRTSCLVIQVRRLAFP